MNGRLGKAQASTLATAEKTLTHKFYNYLTNHERVYDNRYRH